MQLHGHSFVIGLTQENTTKVEYWAEIEQGDLTKSFGFYTPIFNIWTYKTSF